MGNSIAGFLINLKFKYSTIVHNTIKETYYETPIKDNDLFYQSILENYLK